MGTKLSKLLCSLLITLHFFAESSHAAPKAKVPDGGVKPSKFFSSTVSGKQITCALVKGKVVAGKKSSVYLVPMTYQEKQLKAAISKASGKAKAKAKKAYEKYKALRIAYYAACETTNKPPATATPTPQPTRSGAGPGSFRHSMQRGQAAGFGAWLRRRRPVQ